MFFQRQLRFCGECLTPTDARFFFANRSPTTHAIIKRQVNGLFASQFLVEASCPSMDMFKCLNAHALSNTSLVTEIRGAEADMISLERLEETTVRETNRTTLFNQNAPKQNHDWR